MIILLCLIIAAVGWFAGRSLYRIGLAVRARFQPLSRHSISMRR